MTGNFIVYLIGYVVAIVGVAFGLNAAGLGREWIIAIVLVMIGLGIVYAMSRSQVDRLAHRHSETDKTQNTVIQQTPPASSPPSSREP